MNRRRGLALVMAVVALATVMASAAATPALAKAKPTICVALVVDGRSLGSDVSTSCAKVSKGSTGYDVLRAGGHRVSFRNDGLICTIDGLPKSGCAAIDDTHYWAYFHRAPGATKWVYSIEGATTYQPVDDSTDGWVYDDGKALTPENLPYAQICKAEASASPTPKPSASRPLSPSPAPTHHETSPAASHSAPATTPTPSPRPSPLRTLHPRRPRPEHTTPAPASPTPSSTSGALTGGGAPPSNHHGWLDLLIGLVVVAALGGLAAIRFRRSER